MSSEGLSLAERMSGSWKQNIGRRFDSNHAAVLLGAVAVALGIMSTLALARLLGTEDFGRYAIFVAAVRLLVLPSEAGLPQLVTREMNRGDRAHVVAWSKQILVVASVVVTIIFLAVEQFFRSGITIQTWLIVAAVAMLGALHLCRGILLGDRQTIAALSPDSVLRPATLVGLVLVAAGTVGLDSQTAEIAFVTAIAVALSFAAVLARRVQQGSANSTPVQIFDRTLLRKLVPLTLIKGVRLVNRRVEILVLGALALTSEVAIYNVALQLTGLILLAQTMVNSRLSPHVAEASKHRPEQLPGLVAQAVRISTAFAGAAFLGLLLLGRFALGLLGDGFSDAYSLLVVLGLANVLSAALGPTTMLLNMSDHAEDSFRSGLVAAVANIALMFLLIPRFGAMGAAISAASVTVLIQVQRRVLVHRRLGIRPDVIAALR